MLIGVLLAIGAYVLSLGSPLLVGNHNTAFHMPAGILHHLPLIDGAVLARFSVFVFLFAALVLGVAMERLRRWPRWPNQAVGLPVAVLVCGAALIPLLPALPYPEIAVDTPSFFTTDAVDSVPQSSVAVVYPPTTPLDADSTLWQASAAMRFKMPGGYVMVPVPGNGPPVWGSATLTTATLEAIQGGATVTETPTLRHALRAQWRRWGAQTFIMGPGGDEAAARAFVTWVIGKPPVATARGLRLVPPPTFDRRGLRHSYRAGLPPALPRCRAAHVRRSAASTRRFPLSRRITSASRTDRMAR